MKRSAILTMLVVFLLGICGSSLAAEPPAEVKILGVGDMMKDFTLPSLDGGDMTYSKDIKGKKDYSVLVFMTTACSMCQAEIASMSDLVPKYGEKFDLYAVSVDIRGKDSVKPYAEAYKYKTTYLLDPEFTVPKIFGFRFTPAAVVLDKNGKVVHLKGGRRGLGDEPTLEETVLGLVK